MPPNKRNPAPKNRAAESGNVFLMILLGIALFVALSFTISRGMRSESTTNMTNQQLRLVASDILAQAEKVERAVSRVRRKGCSESEISFENPIEGGYVNADARSDNSCHIFNANGGNLTWENPQEGVNDGSPWAFNAEHLVQDLGCSDDGALDGPRCADMVLFLPNLTLAMCNTINAALNISSAAPPVNGVSTLDTSAKFTGNFDDGPIIGNDSGAIINGRHSTCIQESAGEYHFYHVLLER